MPLKSAKSNGGGLELNELKDFKKFLIEYKKLFKMKKEIVKPSGHHFTFRSSCGQQKNSFRATLELTEWHLEGFKFPVFACLDGISKISGFRISGWNFEGSFRRMQIRQLEY
ncbi:hypothetical protein RhiirB3_393958 [Rhizophagus irregularis]|nr:hypothetical protein RhiirB3_393958 [Rhizophagus irregularis]